MNKHIVWFLLALGISACIQQATPGDESVRRSPFFDLSGYIRDYTSDSSTHRVSKSIRIDSMTESKTLDNYSLWKDIMDFDAYDINRPALYDKYSIDTTYTESGYSIRYQPKDQTKNLKVTLLAVSVENEQVNSILIRTLTDSFLDQVQMEIDWNPSRGYTLKRRSNKIFKSEDQYQEVEVSIIP